MKKTFVLFFLISCGQPVFAQHFPKAYTIAPTLGAQVFRIEGIIGAGSTFSVWDSVCISPLVGFGIDYWIRNLDDEGPYGYTERFSVPFATIGMNASYALSERVQLFARAFIKQPTAILETIPISVRDNQSPILPNGLS